MVEDNELNMKLFRDVLAVKGYRALEATTGEEADRAGDRTRADLVLMDVQLPVYDGVERSAGSGRTSAPRRSGAALTAQAMQEDDQSGSWRRASTVAHPVNVRELLRRIVGSTARDRSDAATPGSRVVDDVAPRTCGCSKPCSYRAATR